MSNTKQHKQTGCKRAASKEVNTLPKLKPKTKQWIEYMHSHPKANKTDAYIATHKTNNRTTARQEVAKLLAKPSVILFSQQQLQHARDTVHALVDSKRDDIRLRASESIINRELGTPVQQVQVKSQAITLNIDLSGITDTESSN